MEQPPLHEPEGRARHSVRAEAPFGDGGARGTDAPSQNLVHGWGQWILLILLVTALAVLTANVWLLNRAGVREVNGTREHLFWVLCQPGHTAMERTSAFRELVAGGNKEWRSAQLSELNLEGMVLSGAELQRAGFQRVNFARANLAGAKMNNAALTLADLSGADLTEADLSEAQLYRAVLKDAKLTRAKLRAALLQEIKAEKADFRVADLSDADCLMAKLPGANLAGADLSGARLEGADFTGANFSLTRLNGANLKDADFTNSNWWHARGLTSAQTETLKKKFAPTESAEAGLKADYQKWLSGGK